MKQTERVTQALALVAQGKTPYRAAKMMGIALSTIYKAIKRNRVDAAVWRALSEAASLTPAKPPRP